MLRKLEAVRLQTPQMKDSIRVIVARALAEVDPVEAETLAETVNEPAARAMALLAVARAFPDHERTRKLALLEQALVQARNGARPQLRANLIARVIDRLAEMGERARAEALLPEAIKTVNETGPRGFIAAMLARVDPPGALALAKVVATNSPEMAGRVYTTLARQVAAEKPADAERIWSMIPSKAQRDRALLEVVWKIAEVDPQRAWRFVDSAEQEFEHPQRYLFLRTGCGRAIRPQRAALFKSPWRASIAGSATRSRSAGPGCFRPLCPSSSRSTRPWCRSTSGAFSPCGPREAMRTTGTFLWQASSQSSWPGTTGTWPERCFSPSRPSWNEATIYRLERSSGDILPGRLSTRGPRWRRSRSYRSI